MTKVLWEGKLIDEDELNEILKKQILPGEGKYGLDGWLRSFFINLKPFTEPYSIRQIFYSNLPRIARELPDFVRDHPEDWGDRVYGRMSSILSELVLDGKCSYNQLNIMNDSGASDYIYQNLRNMSVPPIEKCFVEYPIEVWVENNATYNSLIPLFGWNRKEEKAQYQLNLVSGKGFAKTITIEELYLNRVKDVEIILYFGDFDPSGIEMPNDIQRRLKRIGLDIKVVHIGLFPNQIPEERKLATLVHYKTTDPRAPVFQEKYGENTPGYETQALTPSEMRKLIQDSIESAIKEFNLERRDGR
jgi:hypothetical protein